MSNFGLSDFTAGGAEFAESEEIGNFGFRNADLEPEITSQRSEISAPPSASPLPFSNSQLKCFVRQCNLCLSMKYGRSIMSSVQKSIRIPDEVAKTIQEEAESSGRDFSAVANELLAEAVKLKRCPGIVFADGPSGRRARIAGTGLDVWEVVSTYKSLNRDDGRLRDAYHWLSEPQLRSAVAYFRLYPDEIERQILRNDAWSKELSRISDFRLRISNLSNQPEKSSPRRTLRTLS